MGLFNYNETKDTIYLPLQMAKGAQEFRSCQCWSKEHKKELPGNVVMDYSGSEHINVLRGQSVDVALVGVITA